MVRCDACRQETERRQTVVRAGGQRVRLCASCMLALGGRRHDAQAVETLVVVRGSYSLAPDGQGSLPLGEEVLSGGD